MTVCCVCLFKHRKCKHIHAPLGPGAPAAWPPAQALPRRPWSSFSCVCRNVHDVAPFVGACAHASMTVCLYACMHVCMRACLLVFAQRVTMYAQLHVVMSLHNCVRMHVCIHACAQSCICTVMHPCINACIHAFAVDATVNSECAVCVWCAWLAAHVVWLHCTTRYTCDAKLHVIHRIFCDLWVATRAAASAASSPHRSCAVTCQR